MFDSMPVRALDAHRQIAIRLTSLGRYPATRTAFAALRDDVIRLAGPASDAVGMLTDQIDRLD